MAGYAVGLLHDVHLNDDITAYLERIDDTLAPFAGRFIVHGGRPDVREGELRQTLIVIEFPDTAAAAAWYESPAYQAILPLRTANAQGVVIVIDGVDADHRATDVLGSEPVAFTAGADGHQR